MLKQSRRMRAVQSPVIPVVAELIRAHAGTISLGQGVVNYGPPPECLQALQAFYADPDNHRYQHVQGTPELLSAIADKLQRENRVGLQQRAVVVTAGSNMGFMAAVLAIADPGDEIILLEPYFFNQEMAVVIAGLTPVIVPTDESYQPDLDAIDAAINTRTRAVVTISPNNPTGAVYPEAVLTRISRLCDAHGIYHISDEAYEYFTYGEAEHFSPARLPGAEEHTISLFTLSKSFGFASWRIGYMVIPERLCAAVKKIQDTHLICAPVICQYAAVAALRAGIEYCRAHLRALESVRKVVLDALATLEHRVEVPRADGAFYFLVRVASELDSMHLVERLIREYRVAVIPGSTFGVHDRCCLRIAYGALDETSVAQGMERLVNGINALVGTSNET